MGGSWYRTSGAPFAANGAFARMRSGPSPLAYDRPGQRVAFRSRCEMAGRGTAGSVARRERTGGVRCVLPLVDGW